MAKKTEIEGMRELQQMFRRLGKAPQTVATTAARAGATIAYRAAKANAPVDTGQLKRSLVLKREKRTTPGKAVYDVMPSAEFNNIFVKISEDGNRSYYPASQEYGWLNEAGHYTPGYRYLRNALEDNKAQIERKVITTAQKKVEDIMKKSGG